MNGPFRVANASSVVPSNFAGIYVLSWDGKFPGESRQSGYVGRSDTDLAGRILQSAQEWKPPASHFFFELTTSPRAAYLAECRLYHEFLPNLVNDLHPAVPDGTDWRCPMAGCEWS